MKEIATALCKFQAEITNVPFDGTNPHFKNRYATLAGIIDHIRPVMAKNGLSVSQLVNQSAVTTKLLHVSGELLESETAILCAQPNNPQSYGSAVTYARRYALAGILGISADDDDDATEAAASAQKVQAQANQPASKNKPATAKFGAKSEGNRLVFKAKIDGAFKMLPIEQTPLDQLEWYAANSTSAEHKAAAAEYLQKLKEKANDPQA